MKFNKETKYLVDSNLGGKFTLKLKYCSNEMLKFKVINPGFEDIEYFLTIDDAKKKLKISG